MTLLNTYATKEGAEYFSTKINALIDLNTDFCNKLSQIALIIQQVLKSCCLFSQLTKLTLGVEVAKMAKVSIYRRLII